MPDTSNGSPRPSSSSDPLTERVRNRLLLAGQSFDRRRRASRPKSRRRKLPKGLELVSSVEDNAEGRERACLRSVFREMGEAHRRYRTRTGVAGTPALRAAARAFKEAPSLGSLVPVAAHLDELGVLAW